MNAADKKRLIWILITIFFFFANLTVVVVMLISGNPKPGSATASRPAATQ